MRVNHLPALLSAFLAALTLSACTTPTTAPPLAFAVAPDPRAQLVFRFNGINEELPSARVLVDGLDVGALGDFASGPTALRVSAGTHNIRVTYFDRVLLDQRVTVADGERQALTVR